MKKFFAFTLGVALSIFSACAFGSTAGILSNPSPLDLSTQTTGTLPVEKLPSGDAALARLGLGTGIHAQTFTAQTSVTVTHGLGVNPSVQVVDNTGAVLIPATITHASVNAFTVTFQTATTGTIIYGGGNLPVPVTVGNGGTGATNYATARHKIVGVKKNVTQTVIAGGIGFSNGTDTDRNYEQDYTFTQFSENLRLCYSNNVFSSSMVQTGPGNPITVAAGLECTTTTSATKSGTATMTLADGGYGCFDPIRTVGVPTGTKCQIRSWVSVSAGGRWPLFIPTGTGSSYSNNGIGNQSAGTGAFSNSGTQSFGFGPIAVLGDVDPDPLQPTITPKTACLIGDSLDYGANDSYPYAFPVGAGGILARGLGIKTTPIPNSWIQFGVGATNAAQFVAAGNTQLFAALNWCDVFLVEHGVNEVPFGPTLAKSHMLELWNKLAPFGPVYQTTLPPKTTSTNAWKDTASQTVAATEATRLDLNAYYRSLPSPLAGVIEVADTVECNAENVATRNGGFWCVTDTTAYESGTATGGGVGSLVDSSKSWTSNEFRDKILHITGGTGSGKLAVIFGNTSNTLNTGTIGATPDATSTYEVIDIPTIDGTHGTPLSYGVMGVPVGSAMTTINAQ